ncbi:hypothetical protein QBC47DRAFT_387152 [Echria macrotheca]|uniref:Fucose-specific lectin n=1 Tax=Echria macrotheca TaxID=438768 RepID=A0AAJ0B973_9PEZI|nr:hypothetical protein QBC47DRAFT_387152 [Echria macrotheca]
MAAHGERARLSYSNLETVQNLHSPRWNPLLGNGLEVVPDGHHRPYEHNDKHHVFVRSKDDKILVNADPQPPEVAFDEGNASTPPAKIWGIRRKLFWIFVALTVIVVLAASIGGGIGARLAADARTKQSIPSSDPDTNSGNSTTSSSPARAPFRNLGIAALRWVDGKNISHFHLYSQSTNSTHTRVLESSWDSNSETWTVAPITDDDADEVKPGTPIAVSAGFPHTNTSIELVKSVFFLQSAGTITERQSPFKEQDGVWGNDNFSGLYSASNASSIFSYWYQDLQNRTQILATFFQELGANSLTVGRYIENGVDDGLPWESTRNSISIQDGSPIVAVPAGSRRDLRLYIGGTDGTMKQYAYSLDQNVLGNPINTALPLSPHTPFCVTIEDNRNWYTTATLPECTRTSTGTFITHLLLYASADRGTLSLVSWNCSSGFVEQQSRIEKLLKPNRTYLGLASTSASNLTFVDQRVYVLFDEGAGPQVEEWGVPASGGLNIAQQNGPWNLLGSVPIQL